MTKHFLKPPFKPQQQAVPGRSAKMEPQPDYGEKTYRGSNKLKWVAVGGMEPSAAQIESHTRDIAGPGSPSDPRRRLKHHRREMTRREPPRRGNAPGARPDYHDVHVSAHLRHT